MIRTPRYYLAARRVRQFCQATYERLNDDHLDAAVDSASQAVALARAELDETAPEFGTALLAYSSALGQAGDFAESEPLLRELESLGTAAFGGDATRYAAMLNNLAVICLNDDRLDEAQHYMAQCIETKRAALGPDHPSLIGSLQDMVACCERRHAFESALAYLHNLRAIIELNAGPHDADVGLLWAEVARFSEYVGHYEEAAKANAHADEILMASENVDDLFDKALKLYSCGEFAEAMRLHRVARARSPWLGPLSEVAEHLGWSMDPLLARLGELDQEASRAADAERLDVAVLLYQQALAIARTTFGEGHPNFAILKHNLGGVQRKIGHLEEAQKLYEESLAVLRHAHNAELAHLAIHNLATLFLEQANLLAPDPQDDLDDALAFMREGPEGYSRSLRFRSPIHSEGDVAAHRIPRVLAARAAFYESAGDLKRASLLHDKAYELSLIIQYENPEQHMTLILELSRFLMRTGAFSRAETVLREALEIADRLSSGADTYRMLLSLLGECLTQIGNFPAARHAFEECLALARHDLGDDHPTLRQHAEQLGIFFLMSGDWKAAEPYVREVLAGSHDEGEDTVGERTAHLASLAAAIGDTEQAEILYRRAVVLLSKRVGTWDPLYAKTLSNLATLQRECGHFKEAEELYLEAIKTRRVVLGPEHPELAESLLRLALLLATTGRKEEAFNCLEEILTIDSAALKHVFPGSSEAQRALHLRRQSGHLEFAVTLGLHLRDTPGIPGRVANLVVPRKAIGAETLLTQRHAVLGGRYPMLRDELEELWKLHRAIASAMMAIGKVPMQIEELSEARRELDRLEAHLARQIPEIDLQKRLADADRNAVAAALADDAAAVEFLAFNPLDLSEPLSKPAHDPARYFAIIILGGAPNDVKLIDLGAREPIDSLIHELVATMMRVGQGQERPHLARVQHLGTLLRARIFDPLREALAGRNRIFCAPDGDLALIPFEILPGEEEDSYIIDEYEFCYLGTSRDLLRKDLSGSGSGPPLIIADPDFDAGSEKPSPAPHRTGSVLRSAGIHFPRLPGTRQEAEMLAELMPRATFVVGEAASESAVELASSAPLLHLATHGFFLPWKKDDETDPAHHNALANSGLALAGANSSIRGEQLPGALGDGLLTAVDILSLDLRHVRLVVLSACSTGVGSIQEGEGVHGLRRAFRVAGASAVIMSLWPVSDDETRHLMSVFYTLLRSGAPPHAALRGAQHEIRQTLRHPFYWGSFICEGTSSPLPPDIFS